MTYSTKKEVGRATSRQALSASRKNGGLPHLCSIPEREMSHLMRQNPELEVALLCYGTVAIATIWAVVNLVRYLAGW